eukprot:84-Heterocapsa_arctica.AAC.1
MSQQATKDPPSPRVAARAGCPSSDSHSSAKAQIPVADTPLARGKRVAKQLLHVSNRLSQRVCLVLQREFKHDVAVVK